MSTSSLDPSFLEAPSSSHSPIKGPSRNGTEDSRSGENVMRSATRMAQRENSSGRGNHNKRSSSSSACKKSGSMSDLVRNQLFTSPTKRRRRYRRRNSIYIRKENMEQWTNTMLRSMGEKGKKDEDEDHQSLPDLFSSNDSIGDIANEGDAKGSGTSEKTSSNAKVYKELHTSWSNPQDTQSFMEFSKLSLDGNDDESEEVRGCCTEQVNKVATNEDSITSFTASGSDWTTGSSSYMDLR